MGIYIFNKDVLIKRIIEDAEQPASVHDFGFSIIPGMVGEIEYTGINTMISGAILALSMLIIIRAWS